MRVITGSARGHRLYTLEGRETRPTTSRVKEAIMSAIQFEIPDARVIDLFAGTGQLGIETLSRGAEHCVFVELSPDADHIIRENLRETKLIDKASVYQADVTSWLARNQELFDIAFVDPPYDKHILPGILSLLEKKMSDQGIMICESAHTEDLPQKVGRFSLTKDYSYGKRKVTLYRNNKE